MNCYPLRAKTKNGDSFVFTGTDVPCFISKEEFVLMNKANTPILQAGYIRRGCDVPNVFEGDVIECNGIEYLVRYHRGFICSDKDRNTKFLYELKNFRKVAEDVDVFHGIKANYIKSVYYKYRDTLIFPQHFMAVFNGYAIISGIGSRVSVDELQQDANASYEKNKLFFGDLVNGYPLEMYYGRLAIKDSSGGIYDIVLNKYIQED